MSESGKRILLVGHCTPDVFAMRMALGRFAPGVEFVAIGDEGALRDRADSAAGLLVNRILDGRFSAANGIDLIAGLDDAVRARAALVSDLEQAQAQATAAGALAGFGKSDMYSDQARGCIEAMLASAG